jgi:acyl-CoA dehydrogenase
MPKEWGGMGLGHVQLAMVQAEAARTGFGPFAINAQAPDEGNMHTLQHWGTDEQKQQYLKPLCEGTARSRFAMTEPEVAGSDPTLIRTRACHQTRIAQRTIAAYKDTGSTRTATGDLPL